MLKSVYIDNYKSLVNFRIDFDDLSILIGKNGSGKTSIFRVIELLRDFVGNHKEISSCFSPDTTTRWMSVSIQTFELVLNVEEAEYKYHLEIEHNLDEWKSRVSKEYVSYNENYLFQSENGKAKLYNDSFQNGADVLWDWAYSGVGTIHERNDNKLLSQFKKELSKIIVCAPRPDKVVATVDSDQPVLNYDCSNVARVFMFLSQRYPESVATIKTHLQEINSGIASIYLDGEGRDKTLRFGCSLNGYNYYLNLDELSEGEIALFVNYLIVDGYIANGYTVLIDEPDNHVSLRELQPWLMSVEDSLDGKGQCIIISHHPEIIDFQAQTGGKWLTRLKYGATRMMDSPNSPLSEVMTYSEMIRRGEVE